MPEGMNVEVAHNLSEPEHPGKRHGHWHEVLEMAEVLILAVVAVMTACPRITTRTSRKPTG